MLTTWTVDGSAFSTTWTLIVGSGDISLNFNNAGAGTGTLRAPDAMYDSIRINDVGGNDTLNIVQPGDNTVTFDGGAGNDTLNVGTGFSIENFNSNITFIGGADLDTLNYNDQTNPASDSYTVSNEALDRTSNGSVFYSNGVEQLAVNGGTGNNAFTINGTMGSDMVVKLDGGAGNDSFTFGSFTTSVENLDSSFILIGGSGTDSFAYNDTVNTADGAFNLSNESVHRVGNGLVDFTDSIEAAVIRGGSGDDDFKLYGSQAGISIAIDGSFGDDDFSFGNGSSLTDLIDNLDAAYTFFGGDGADSLRVLDWRSTASSVFTLNNETIVRNGTGLIDFSSQIESLELESGSGNGIINISGTQNSDLVIYSDTDGGTHGANFGNGAGSSEGFNAEYRFFGFGQSVTYNDQFKTTPVAYTLSRRFDGAQLNRPGNGPVYARHAGITINAGNAGDTFSATGEGSLWSASYRFFGNGGDDSILLGDFATPFNWPESSFFIDGDAGNDSFTYSDVLNPAANTFNLNGRVMSSSTLDAGSYAEDVESVIYRGSPNADTFNISGNTTSTAIAIDGGLGDDSFVFGDATRSIDGLDATYTVFGGPGSDTISYNDLLTTTPTTYALANEVLARSGAGSVNFTNAIETMIVRGGSAGDTFNLIGTQFDVNIRLDGRGGDDQFIFGAPTLFPAENLDATYTIFGGDQTDTVIFNDQQNGSNDIFAFQGPLFGRTNGGLIDYGSGVESLVVNAGRGTNQFDVTDPAAPVRLNTGTSRDPITPSVPEGDIVNVINTLPGKPVYLGSDPLDRDRVTVNTDSAGNAELRVGLANGDTTTLRSLAVNAGGTAAISTGNNHALRVESAMNLAFGGRVDVNDGLLIINVATVAAVGGIRSQIQSAYNAGAWTGAGVTSTAARLDPTDRTGLGYGLPAQITAPGMFRGRAVGANDLIVACTVAGDANLNATVDVTDLGILATNFRGTGRVFSQSDFNYDGTVDVADLGLLAQSFRYTLPVAFVSNSSSQIAASVIGESQSARAILA